MRLEKLDPPIDLDHDHVLGPPDAELTLVEYAAAKIAIFIASLIAAVLGMIILYPQREEESEPELENETSEVGCAI